MCSYETGRCSYIFVLNIVRFFSVIYVTFWWYVEFFVSVGFFIKVVVYRVFWKGKVFVGCLLGILYVLLTILGSRWFYEFFYLYEEIEI